MQNQIQNKCVSNGTMEYDIKMAVCGQVHEGFQQKEYGDAEKVFLEGVGWGQQY
jgi:hypothetical protein